MNRSLTRLTDKSKSKQPPSAAKDDDTHHRPEPSSVVPTTLEAALEKANVAVLYDSTGNPHDAMHAYVEAVELLRKVFTEETDTDDLARLCKIVRIPVSPFLSFPFVRECACMSVMVCLRACIDRGCRA